MLTQAYWVDNSAKAKMGIAYGQGHGLRFFSFSLVQLGMLTS